MLLFLKYRNINKSHKPRSKVCECDRAECGYLNAHNFISYIPVFICEIVCNKYKEGMSTLKFVNQNPIVLESFDCMIISEVAPLLFLPTSQAAHKLSNIY
jgi:hypothetical protein